ncbi:two-component response regulator-like PRR37 [Cornus florida]|uniref:two-component response regulator-like PRR37 n=1 Tax=Cornus florida TaxID=4283 RepID=UPI002897223D|nr:two-component response regulator-like PRR37 [Cornus florida]XP_059626708.1 two-component response regulator-like PRR37 [Cornus florida]
MGPVPINNDVASDTDLAGWSNCSWDGKKVVRNVVEGEVRGFGSSEEDELRTKNGSEGVIQVSAGVQKSGSQGPLVHWERFLPFRSLKVLLVENDDCTRHVVSALLRNCSYEVTAVANGLQAWKILEDLTNHIDLVLTEVVMPFFSGIGLLCKIMSHKTFKNIPVIMMSSHDPMNLVFKCLSKGAVDFLVKPIRKNELKNLWQHVWRRCHSSSGSGSESGTQTTRSAKSKSNESEKDTGSSDERDNGSIGLCIRDGSDNGSGTQSSWTKRAAEVESPRPISPWDQLADVPDSTCAQVNRTETETLSSRWVHVTETKQCLEQDKQLDKVAMGKDLEIGMCRDPDSQLEYHKFSTQPGSKRQDKLSRVDSKVLEKEQLENESENISGKLRDYAANLICAVGSCTDQQVESRDIDASSGLPDTSQIKDKASSDSRELPSLELTLERMKRGDIGTSAHDNHNVLRHSNLSAFSKYYTVSSANQAPTGNVGSCSPLDNSSVAVKTERMHSLNCNPTHQQSNGSSNNNDTASTTKYVHKHEAFSDKTESISAFKCSNTSMFQTAQNGRICAEKPIHVRTVDEAVGTDQAQERGSNKRIKVQHHHHHYHHYHHHVHNMQHQPESDHDDLSLKMAAAAPQCGSSNMLGGPTEGSAGNYSFNKSASGSNHGSNGQNGSTALNAGVANIGSDNGVAENSGIVGISGSGRISGNEADEDRLAQREAVLTKFRQKRKERCFGKKVRYQSRKRLAEQRPRVRGQFVRPTGSDTTAGKDSRQDNIMSEEGLS